MTLQVPRALPHPRPCCTPPWLSSDLLSTGCSFGLGALAPTSCHICDQYFCQHQAHMTDRSLLLAMSTTFLSVLCTST